MNHETVSNRYAKALFEVGLEKKLLDKLVEDMKLVQEGIGTSPQLIEWLYHPATDIEEKKKVVSQLFKNVHAVTLHFLFVVMDHHRENMLNEIISQFYGLVHEEKGEIEASVISAFPLSTEDEQQLTSTFQQMLEKKILLKEMRTDSDLLGGAVVQIGDRIFDGSLKTKLIRFQERVKRAGV